MFASLLGGVNKVRQVVARSFASCEDEKAESKSILEQADEIAVIEDATFRTPVQFDVLRMLISPTGGHNNFDGFRMTVSKPLNMNAQVQHTYIMGSQMTNGQSVYQYRAVYGTEGATVQVGSDLDFNTDGYARYQVIPGGALVAKWAFRDTNNYLDLIYEGEDACSSYTATYNPYASTLGLSFMQALTPGLAMGGLYNFNIDKHISSMSFGGIFNYKQHSIVALWDEDWSSSLTYSCAVNPNRVNLSSELKIDPQQGPTFAAGAEYTLKQAKLQMSLDSNFTLRSCLESQMMPGIKLQVAAELQHANDQFKCGYGISMGD
jgi:hypothetical protein